MKTIVKIGDIMIKALSVLLSSIALIAFCTQTGAAANIGEYVPNETQNDMIYLFSNPRFADGGAVSNALDDAGNLFGGPSVIDLVGQAHKYAAVYSSPYWMNPGWRYKINLATSDDLLHWHYVRTLIDNSDLPKMTVDSTGTWIIITHEQWMTQDAHGADQGPVRATFELIYSYADLMNGVISQTWISPQYAPSGLMGTPSFYSATVGLNSYGKYVVNGAVGFHWFDGSKDENGNASFTDLFDPAHTGWYPSTATGYDNDLISAGATGSIGQRDTLQCVNGRYNIQEGNVGGVGGDFSNWRIFLYTYGDSYAWPTGSGTALQLSVQTKGGSTSFGNPGCSVVLDPNGSGRHALFISYFIFSEGSGAGESGSLIFYWHLNG
jgi:hypothetical protein